MASEEICLKMLLDGCLPILKLTSEALAQVS